MWCRDGSTLASTSLLGVLTADDSATTLSCLDYDNVTMAPLFAGRGDASRALEKLSRQRAVAVSPCKCATVVWPRWHRAASGQVRGES